MTKHLTSAAVAAGLALVTAGGCQHCFQRKSCPPPCPPAPVPATSQSFLMPPRYTPNAAGPLPPTCQLGCPSGVLPADVRQSNAPPNPTWGPPPGARLSVPEQTSPEARLSPQPLPPGPEKPGVAENRSGTPALPVDIPQFASVKDRIASGLRPNPDGLVWLQEKGYRTVLHVRSPGEDDAADRRLIEMRGLRYLSLQLSPQTLTKETVDLFNTIVGDANNLPLFVYDKDGMLAGSLWYLHFRQVENLSDEQARVKASRLGLKEDPAGEHRAMWVAIQNYLSVQKP